MVHVLSFQVSFPLMLPLCFHLSIYEIVLCMFFDCRDVTYFESERNKVEDGQPSQPINGKK